MGGWVIVYILHRGLRLRQRDDILGRWLLGIYLGCILLRLCRLQQSD